MAKITLQQKWLGWEHIDRSHKFFLCMCQVEGQPARPISGHSMLTYAVRNNGNRARNWKKELGASAIETGVNEYNRGIWTLTVGGKTIKLYVDHIDRSALSPVPIDYTPIEHERGQAGRSTELLAVVKL